MAQGELLCRFVFLLFGYYLIIAFIIAALIICYQCYISSCFQGWWGKYHDTKTRSFAVAQHQVAAMSRKYGSNKNKRKQPAGASSNSGAGGGGRENGSGGGDEERGGVAKLAKCKVHDYCN